MPTTCTGKSASPKARRRRSPSLAISTTRTGTSMPRMTHGGRLSTSSANSAIPMPSRSVPSSPLPVRPVIGEALTWHLPGHRAGLRLARQAAPSRCHPAGFDGGPPVPQLHQPGLDHLQAVEEAQDLGVAAVGVLLVADAV